MKHNVDDTRKQILFIEDRPMELTNRILNSDYVLPVILRFQHLRSSFTQDYLKQTEDNYYVFWVNIMNPIEYEAQRFQRWQKSCGLDVRYFLNPSEVAQYFAQSFARELGLPCLTQEQTYSCRNKARMKDKLREIGLCTADYREIVSTQDLIQAGNELGWPIVLKPADDSACRQTYLLHNSDEAKRIYLHSEHQWLAEQFIDLAEYALDALVFDGQIIDFYPIMYPEQIIKTLDGAINANITLRRYSNKLADKAKYILEKYIRGMGIRHGYVHIEYFASVDHSTVILGEVGLRLAGSEIPSDHELSYGFDLFDALIKIHTGERPELLYTEDRFVGDLLLPVHPGQVVEVSTMDELMKMEGVIGGRIKVKPGEIVHPERASLSCSGYVFVEGSSAEEVRTRMYNILHKYKFVALEIESV